MDAIQEAVKALETKRDGLVAELGRINHAIEVVRAAFPGDEPAPRARRAKRAGGGRA